MVLNNGLGRPKVTKKFDSVFKFVQGYIIPNKDLLEWFKADEFKKRRIHEKALAKVTLQETKVNNSYNYLTDFKR